jgi:ATP-binding cassette, subfamily F, member 3
MRRAAAALPQPTRPDPPCPRMINLRNLTLRRGAKVVLDGASFTLHAGEKASLVGRNGAGKSSLFSLLADQRHP